MVFRSSSFSWIIANSGWFGGFFACLFFPLLLSHYFLCSALPDWWTCRHSVSIAWGVSSASSFWLSSVSVRSIFPHSILSHYTPPREGNEGLITGNFINTFIFEVCFEDPYIFMKEGIIFWINIFSLCYIPFVCVLSPAIGKGMVLIWMTKCSDKACSEVIWQLFDSLWTKSW